MELTQYAWRMDEMLALPVVGVPKPAAGKEVAGATAAEQEGPGEQTAEVEIGGRRGPDPTRYGDWEKNGRCIDF
jgi:hypothetical protein